jgi:hypothetical protein
VLAITASRADADIERQKDLAMDADRPFSITNVSDNCQHSDLVSPDIADRPIRADLRARCRTAITEARGDVCG